MLAATGAPNTINHPRSTTQSKGVDGPYACSSGEGTPAEQTCLMRAKHIV